MKTCLYPVILSICFVFAVAFIGCGRSGNAPTQANEGSWTISGKTYLVGSIDPLPGVLVKCAGRGATSGADGSYEIRGVPGGTQILTAEKSGAEIYSRSIEINSDLTQYLYLSFKTTNLSGYVTNSVDGPIKGAKVVMLDFVDYTDISGHYLISNIRQGSATLSISHPRYTVYNTVLSLDSSNRQFDVALTRDSVIQITTIGSAYVDESVPVQVMPIVPYRLYLRDNGYDSAGVYRGKIRRFIYVWFNFPQIFSNEAVTIVEANLQLCTDGPYSPSAFRTYLLTSGWTSSTISFSRQPTTGSLLTSGTVGDSSSAKYWTVLDVGGFIPLLAQWRASGLIYGVMIQGGRLDPMGFFSAYAPANRPRITFKVHF